MVRTKADSATRVAAGGKAPKKTANRAPPSPASNSDRGGKDNLPGNRYCPRETPTWQKKITFFYNKNDDEMNASGIAEDNDTHAEAKQHGKENRKKKANCIDDSDEIDTNESERSSKKKDAEAKNETDQDESMETD